MRYSVLLNGLTQTQADAWADDMRRNGHMVNAHGSTPVAPVASGAPATHAAPATTDPAPPAVDGFAWVRATNGNGWKAPDPMLSDVMWLWNGDGRPLDNGTSGAWVVKARVFGRWWSVAARPEFVRQFGGSTTPANSGFPRGRRARA
jgi:hypothetical protein